MKEQNFYFHFPLGAFPVKDYRSATTVRFIVVRLENDDKVHLEGWDDSFEMNETT